MDTLVTDIFFIKTTSNQVVAVFPHKTVYNQDNCLCYQASKYSLIHKNYYLSAPLATTDESLDLWNELLNLGYNLNLFDRNKIKPLAN